jgi:hypothetical protein
MNSGFPQNRQCTRLQQIGPDKSACRKGLPCAILADLPKASAPLQVVPEMTRETSDFHSWRSPE